MSLWKVDWVEARLALGCLPGQAEDIGGLNPESSGGSSLDTTLLTPHYPFKYNTSFTDLAPRINKAPSFNILHRLI